MTAVHVAYLRCELKLRDCESRYPTGQPIESTITDLRQKAREAGWETMNHNVGRDVCPHCRITEIKRKMTTPAALSETEVITPKAADRGRA